MAAIDLHQWELDLQAELPRHMNDAQFDKAMREAMACCSTATTALKEADKSNVMALEWEAKAEARWECQAFTGTFWAVVQTCPPDAQGTFMYPLPLLTGDVLLAAIMGMSTAAQVQTVEGIATTPKATNTVPKTPAAP